MGKRYAWALLEIRETENFEKNKAKETNKIFWKEISTVKMALAQQIQIEFTQIATQLYGEIWGSLFLENMTVYYADLQTKLCLMRINAMYKKEFFMVQCFVKIKDFFTVKTLRICTTMNQCKKLMKKYLLTKNFIDNFPNFFEEIEPSDEN